MVQIWSWGWIYTFLSAFARLLEWFFKLKKLRLWLLDIKLMQKSHNLRDHAIGRGVCTFCHSWRLCPNHLYFFKPDSEKYVPPRTTSLHKFIGCVKSSVGHSAPTNRTFFQPGSIEFIPPWTKYLLKVPEFVKSS